MLELLCSQPWTRLQTAQRTEDNKNPAIGAAHAGLDLDQQCVCGQPVTLRALAAIIQATVCFRTQKLLTQEHAGSGSMFMVSQVEAVVSDVSNP